jgi:hypothetical protein
MSKVKFKQLVAYYYRNAYLCSASHHQGLCSMFASRYVAGGPVPILYSSGLIEDAKKRCKGKLDTLFSKVYSTALAPEPDRSPVHHRASSSYPSAPKTLQESLFEKMLSNLGTDSLDLDTPFEQMPKKLVLMLPPIIEQWREKIRSNGNAWRIEPGRECLEMSFRKHRYEYRVHGSVLSITRKKHTRY